MAVLNETLAKKQKITQEQRDNLDALYDGMDMLFEKARNDTNIKLNGPIYAKQLKELEFNLQKNWNFPLDETKHTWWNRFSDCKCPKMDNDERFGMDKIINSNCPFHGSKDSSTNVKG
jgi:hypothetical protein